MPDIRMPDGTILRNVPEGTSRAEVQRRWQQGQQAKRYSGLSYDDAAAAYRKGRQDLATLTRGKSAAERSRAIQNYEASPTATALRRQMNNRSGMFGAMAGMIKPVDNLALWTSKIPGVGPAIDSLGQAMGLPSADQAYNRNQRARSANTEKGAQVIGNIAGTLPTLAIGGPAAPFVQGAVQGATLTEDARNPGDVLGNALLGGLTGWGLNAALGKVASGLRGFVANTLRDQNIALLAKEGVTMSPAQRGGRLANFIEDKFLGSLPLVSEIPKATRAAATNDLRVAAANRVLSPIGANIERGTPMNNLAIGKVQDIVNTAYDDAISPLAVRYDPALDQGLNSALAGAAGDVGPEGAAQLASYADSLRQRLAPGLSGAPLKREIQNLREVASNAMQKDTLLGQKFWGIADSLDNALESQNGAAAGQFRLARESQALLHRLNDAASRPGVVNGEFGPTQLLSAAKRKGYGTNSANIANNTARMLDLANAGADVLRVETANSGTIPRALSTLGIGGAGYGVGAGAINPIVAGAPIAAALAPYIPQVNRALQTLKMAERPEAVKALGEYLSRYAPALGPAGTAAVISGRD